MDFTWPVGGYGQASAKKELGAADAEAEGASAVDMLRSAWNLFRGVEQPLDWNDDEDLDDAHRYGDRSAESTAASGVAAAAYSYSSGARVETGSDDDVTVVRRSWALFQQAMDEGWVSDWVKRFCTEDVQLEDHVGRRQPVTCQGQENMVKYYNKVLERSWGGKTLTWRPISFFGIGCGSGVVLAQYDIEVIPKGRTHARQLWVYHVTGPAHERRLRLVRSYPLAVPAEPPAVTPRAFSEGHAAGARAVLSTPRPKDSPTPEMPTSFAQLGLDDTVSRSPQRPPSNAGLPPPPPLPAPDLWPRHSPETPDTGAGAYNPLGTARGLPVAAGLGLPTRFGELPAPWPFAGDGPAAAAGVFPVHPQPLHAPGVSTAGTQRNGGAVPPRQPPHHHSGGGSIVPVSQQLQPQPQPQQQRQQQQRAPETAAPSRKQMRAAAAEAARKDSETTQLAAAASAAGESAAEDSPPPPCNHNVWDNVRIKRSWSILRCRKCQLQWRLRPPSIPHCPAFARGAGHCPHGSDCTMVHVFRMRENVSKSAGGGTTEGDSESRAGDGLPTLGSELHLGGSGDDGSPPPET